MAPVDLQTVSLRHNAMAILPRQVAGAAAPLSSGLMIGIAVAGATVLFMVSSVIAYLIIRKRKQHRLAMAELENRIPTHQMAEVPRPVSGIRCGRLVPLPQSQAAWDALGSNDTIDRPEPAAKRESGLVKVPKRKRGISLKKWKHLSAIVESPRSLSRRSSAVPSMSLQRKEKVTEMIGSPGKFSIRRVGEAVNLGPGNGPQARPGSPSPDVLPSFAIKSPTKYGAVIANDDNRPDAAMRSVSMGVLGADSAVFDAGEHCMPVFRRVRPDIHTRSISLGAPPTAPPSRPVPPLPVLPPLPRINTNFNMRHGLCISPRSSTSSIDSAGSSVLVTSPILNRHDENEPLGSPTVEEIVAGNDNAELKSVANRHWQGPRIAIPRPSSGVSPMRVEKSRGSARANIARASPDSALTRRVSIASTASSDTTSNNRLSIPLIGTADRISISRVSSSNSLQKIETPPRRQSQRRSQVSANGSPSERKRKTSVLTDFSGNASRVSPRRQMAIPTQDSGRSSNGSPFHQKTGSASSLSKPSALKGSPNARKGQRRQSCVRISTLTPQVLGPLWSSSASLAGIMMDEIAEERESDELIRETGGRQDDERAVAQQQSRSRLPTPNGTTSNDSNMQIQTLRASLTPSSPTLSTWTSFNETGLQSQPSDVSMSALALSGSPHNRAESRKSNHSVLVIPSFPTPARTRASAALSQIDTAPMPLSSRNMESRTMQHAERRVSNPFKLDWSSEELTPVSPTDNSPVDFSPVSPIDVPSSPPLPISKTKQYDVAWSVVFPTPRDEYDPASPPLLWTPENADDREEQSSYFLPFAGGALDTEELSSRRRSRSHAAPALVARVPDKSLCTSSFLGTEMPVLTPPDSGYADLPLPRWQPQLPSPIAHAGRAQRLSTTNVNIKPPRAGPPAPALPTIPQSDDSPSPTTIPSPLNVSGEAKIGPRGPRSAPGKSVLRNAMTLRRMNSEARCDRARESRNYIRLGREASPLLPWCPTDSESCHDLLDLDFNTKGGADDEDKGRSSTRMSLARAVHKTDVDAISMYTEGRLTDIDAEHQAWSSPYSTQASMKQNRSRSSSVWEDGEKFWNDRPGTPQSLQLPQFQYAHTGEQVSSRYHEEKTVDPRLLSTPTALFGSSLVAGAEATPKSLYDADGFLKT